MNATHSFPSSPPESGDGEKALREESGEMVTLIGVVRLSVLFTLWAKTVQLEATLSKPRGFAVNAAPPWRRLKPNSTKKWASPGNFPLSDHSYPTHESKRPGWQPSLQTYLILPEPSLDDAFTPVASTLTTGFQPSVLALDHEIGAADNS
ncbi:hypothetical protein, partial [Arthrobacter methylotrophus]